MPNETTRTTRDGIVNDLRGNVTVGQTAAEAHAKLPPGERYGMTFEAGSYSIGVDHAFGPDSASVVIIDGAGTLHTVRDLADAMRKVPTEAQREIAAFHARAERIEAEDLPALPWPPMRRGDFLKPVKYTPSNKTLNRRKKRAEMAKDSK